MYSCALAWYLELSVTLSNQCTCIHQCLGSVTVWTKSFHKSKNILSEALWTNFLLWPSILFHLTPKDPNPPGKIDRSKSLASTVFRLFFQDGSMYKEYAFFAVLLLFVTGGYSNFTIQKMYLLTLNGLFKNNYWTRLSNMYI